MNGRGWRAGIGFVIAAFAPGLLGAQAAAPAANAADSAVVAPSAQTTPAPQAQATDAGHTDAATPAAVPFTLHRQVPAPSLTEPSGSLTAAPPTRQQSKAMMIAGGAAFLAGAIIGGKVGLIFMAGGGVVGLVGLYNW